MRHTRTARWEGWLWYRRIYNDFKDCILIAVSSMAEYKALYFMEISMRILTCVPSVNGIPQLKVTKTNVEKKFFKFLFYTVLKPMFKTKRKS